MNTSSLTKFERLRKSVFSFVVATSTILCVFQNSEANANSVPIIERAPIDAAELENLIKEKLPFAGQQEHLTEDQKDQIAKIISVSSAAVSKIQTVADQQDLGNWIELLNSAYICPSLNEASTQTGFSLPLKALSLEFEVLGKKSPAISIFGSSEEYAKLSQRLVKTQVVDALGGILKWKTEYFLPIVCLKGGMSLSNAALTLVHEFTHMDGYQFPESKFDLTRFENLKSFQHEKLFGIGGEYAAFHTEMDLLSDLKHKISLTDEMNDLLKNYRRLFKVQEEKAYDIFTKNMNYKEHISRNVEAFVNDSMMIADRLDHQIVDGLENQMKSYTPIIAQAFKPILDAIEAEASSVRNLADQVRQKLRE